MNIPMLLTISFVRLLPYPRPTAGYVGCNLYLFGMEAGNFQVLEIKLSRYHKYEDLAHQTCRSSIGVGKFAIRLAKVKC
jgi:hypothetical protein